MATIMDKQGAVSSDETVVVEFDGKNVGGYLLCQACCILPLITSCTICPCIPCLPYCQRKEFESQQCKVTDRRVEYEGGWINHTAKKVPLDRVQDVSITQGCVQRCFGVKSLNVQTAGGAGEGVMAEVSLLAPKNAEMVRDLILERRDHFVLGPGAGRSGMAGGGGVDDICKNGSSVVTVGGSRAMNSDQLTLEVRELKEAVQRIEEHVLHGLKKMDQSDL